ncbi:hypothetical protein D3C72_2107780 [compost metagenome]
MRANLNRAVTYIFHGNTCRFIADIRFYFSFFKDIFSWYHIVYAIKLTDWVVNRNQFRSVRKGYFNLYIVNHFRNTFHHLGTLQ